MNINKLFRLSQLIIIISLPKYIYGCECESATTKFIDGLENYDFVGLVEVIGRDTIKNADYDNSLTLVKVLKQYGGKLIGSIIPVVEGTGFECFVSLPNVNTGSRFIIKASIVKRLEYEANFLTNENPQMTGDSSTVLVLSLCDENAILVMGNYAIGNITQSERLIKIKNSSEWNIVRVGFDKNFKKIGYIVKRQSMFINKAERIIKRHL